jgi:hypothetical protein
VPTLLTAGVDGQVARVPTQLLLCTVSARFFQAFTITWQASSRRQDKIAMLSPAAVGLIAAECPSHRPVAGSAAAGLTWTGTLVPGTQRHHYPRRELHVA